MNLLDLPNDVLAHILTKVKVDGRGFQKLVEKLPTCYWDFVEKTLLDFEDSVDGRFYRCVKYVQRYHQNNNRLGVQEFLVKLGGFEYYIDYTKKTGVFQMFKVKGYQRLGRVVRGKMNGDTLVEVEVFLPSERPCLTYMACAFAWVCSQKGKVDWNARHKVLAILPTL